MSKKRPSVLRICVPDETAKQAALKWLLEQAPGRMTRDGNEARGTDERRPTNGREDM